MGRGPLTLREYLAIYEEAVPDWLARFDLQNPMRPADRLQDFLRSRTVYYPGSYFDGGPVAAFNSAQAAHCFIYVDYHVERQELVNRITRARGQGFLGYDSIAQIDLTEADFQTNRWVPHYRQRVDYTFPPHPPYGFISIFERQRGFDDAHGAWRFAILFLAADGHAAFDAMFCQNNGTPEPFCAVIQNHGFGGDWHRAGFGGGGPMSEIAQDCGVYPRFLLKDVMDGTPAWDGYTRCLAEDQQPVASEPMGMHRNERSLWARAPEWPPAELGRSNG